MVYNAAFVDVPGFVPLTEDEVNLIAERILSIADPRLIKLIFKGDDMIGFLFGEGDFGGLPAGFRAAGGGKK